VVIINNRYDVDFFENYKKIEHDHSFVPTKKGQTLLYPLTGCGTIDRIHWWSEFYVGCIHDCKYCFVCMEALKYNIIKNRSEWKNVKLKYPIEKLFNVFKEELQKAVPGETILHSMTADPFMYGHSESRKIHLKIAGIINKEDINNRFLTKGVYHKINGLDKNLNQFGSSITNLNEKDRRILEPFTAPQKDRISSLHKMSKRGNFTFANITCFPLNGSLRDIDKLLDKISFVDEISFHGLYYFGHPTDEEFDYYYNISSRIYEFACKKDKSFYTTGLVNPHIRAVLKKQNITPIPLTCKAVSLIGGIL